MYAHVSPQKQQARIAALEQEVAELQKELGEGENAEEIVAKHHKSLHEYNEAKDAAQILIGRLAEQKQTTIKQLHEEYGLTGDD